MWLHADNIALTALQALAVALPAAGLPGWLERHRRSGWALVLPVSIVVCVAVIAVAPVSADVYAWLALLLVPPGCALALGWGMRGARPPLALLAVPLLALAFVDGLVGELALDVLILGSCVTLGRLIAGGAPLTLVKLGLVAMAAIDAVLVFSGALAEPAATLNAAQVAPGLPQLQTGVLHFSSLGYGDFLAAGVLGGVLAAEGASAWRWALAVLAVSIVWDQLFLVTDLLPATVPPALVLIAREGNNRPMLRRLAPLSVLFCLLLCSTALAGAGGGTSSFGGGGGGGFSGGGGGFSSGGGSYSGGGSVGGGGAFILVIILLVVVFVVLSSAIAAAKLRKKRRERVKRVTTASAEAAADDAAFAADTVVPQAEQLFRDVQTAWDARDRDRLAALVGSDLMVEWGRRLDDFERKGWHNRVSVTSGPRVEYVGMVNRSDDKDDRVVVRLEATTDDYVETRDGGRVMHNGQSSAATSVKEYWTLDKREGRWCLLSIEQDAEGVHNLDAEIVASPWGDSRVHDEAVAERAAADAAPAGVSPAELVDVDFAGPARAKAMDLSLADGRFDVDLIETSVRRAVSAWAEAVDGTDTDLEAVARPEAVRALLGDAGGRTRVVVRGPNVERVTISALDAEATPPTLSVELAVSARRYVEDRDTVALVSGSRDAETSFTEHWTLALDAEGEWPWRIAATGAAAAA